MHIKDFAIDLNAIGGFATVGAAASIWYGRKLPRIAMRILPTLCQTRQINLEPSRCPAKLYPEMRTA